MGAAAAMALAQSWGLARAGGSAARSARTCILCLISFRVATLATWMPACHSAPLLIYSITRRGRADRDLAFSLFQISLTDDTVKSQFFPEDSRRTARRRAHGATRNAADQNCKLLICAQGPRARKTHGAGAGRPAVALHKASYPPRRLSRDR